MNVYDFDETIFYPDSLSDTPIALLAEKAFLVSDKATKISPWPKISELSKKEKEGVRTGWKHLEE